MGKEGWGPKPLRELTRAAAGLMSACGAHEEALHQCQKTNTGREAMAPTGEIAVRKQPHVPTAFSAATANRRGSIIYRRDLLRCTL